MDPIQPEDNETTPVVGVVHPPTPTPPPAGSNLGEVVRYYTETARTHVPDWDIELIPIAGKNPQINGPGWQTLASSDPMHVLDQTKAAGAGVSGYGALMNRHIAFDVDHPEFLPPALSSIFEEGLRSQSRPGRTHYIFRVPSGTRFGGSKQKLDTAFGVMGKWGEIKAWNSQIRIWSPNPDDGTHVALQPGPIPELPPVLLSLLLPPLASGEMASIAELRDFLALHTESRQTAWLGEDIARLSAHAMTESKYEAMVKSVFHICGNVAGGAYPGEQAYDALLDAYKDLCEADSDWTGDRLTKYDFAWCGAVAKWTRDPELMAAVEEKRAKSAGSIEITEDDLELFRQMAVASGVRVSTAYEEPSPERIQELLVAPSAPEEDEMSEYSSTDSESPERDVEPVSEAPRAIDILIAYVKGLKEEIQGSPGDKDLRSRYERMRALADQLVVLDEEDQARWIANIMSKSQEQLATFLQDVARTQSQAEARDLIREVKLLETRTVVEDEELELAWQEIVPPDALVRSDGQGLLRSGGVVHAVFGDAATGKTTLAVYLAVEQMRLGKHVVWIDYEMGRKRLTNWLLRMGMERKHVPLFHLVDYVGSHGSLSDALRYVRSLEQADWLVLDSVSRAISRLAPEQGGENDSSAFIGVIDGFVSKIADLGVSVYLIDHVGHAEKERQRGSSAKLQQVDVAYSTDVLSPWSRDVAGAGRIVCRKDREGYFTVGDPVAIALFEPLLSHPDPDKRPVRLTLIDPLSTAGAAHVATAELPSEIVRGMDLVGACLLPTAQSKADLVAATALPDKVVQRALYELRDAGRAVAEGATRDRKWRLP